MLVRLTKVAMLIGVGLCGIGLATAAPSTTKPTEPAAPLSIRIGVQEPNAGPAYHEGQAIHVVLTNTSAVPQGVMDEWNSFGYYNLSIDYTRPDGSHHTMTKRDRAWTENYPTATTLQPGECLVRDVHFDPAVWSGLPTKADGNGAIFTVTFKEAGKETTPAVWHGTIQSPPVRVKLPVGSQ